MRTALWSLAAVITGALLTVLTAPPAQWLDLALERVTHGSVRMQGASGSLWSGSGLLVLRASDGLRVAPLAGRVSWRIAGFGEGASLRVVVDSQQVSSMQFELGLSGMRIAAGEGAFSAARFGSIAPRLRALGPDGDLKLRWTGIRYGEGWFSGNIGAVWQDARLAQLQSEPFGSYEMTLTLSGTAHRGVFRTLSGATRVAGEWTWSVTAGHSVSLDSQSSAPPKVSAFLDELRRNTQNASSAQAVPFKAIP